MKKNPEFFSKKVGEKLMKIQNINELLDTNDIIKKSVLTEQERNELFTEYQRVNQIITTEGNDNND